jgi:hypothetical protein
MNLRSLSRIPISLDSAWPELIERRLDLQRLFIFVVLPAVLVTPVSVLVASSQSAGTLPDMLSRKPVQDLMGLLFIAEVFSFLFLGWLLKQVARTVGLPLGHDDAYRLAAIGPVPMWLSGLAVLVPNPLLASGAVLLGLGLSCGTLYHGLCALSRSRGDALVIASIVHVAIGACVAAWAVLLVGMLV